MMPRLSDDAMIRAIDPATREEARLRDGSALRLPNGRRPEHPSRRSSAVPSPPPASGMFEARFGRPIHCRWLRYIREGKVTVNRAVAASRATPATWTTSGADRRVVRIVVDGRLLSWCGMQRTSPRGLEAAGRDKVTDPDSVAPDSIRWHLATGPSPNSYRCVSENPHAGSIPSATATAT